MDTNRHGRRAPLQTPFEGSSFDVPELGRTLLLVHLILSPLLFSNDTVEAFEYPKIALTILTAIVLAALGISEWVGHGRSLGERVSRLRGVVCDPVAWGFVLFLISAAASTVNSISPRLSFRGAPDSHAGLITGMAYTVLFFATRWLCRDEADGRRLLSAAIVGATTASVYAAVQVARVDAIPWECVSTLDTFIRPFGTMAHPNFLAAYLVMAIPVIAFFVDRALARKRWLVLAVLIFTGGTSALAILTAMSRGAWLALACAMTCCGLGWLMVGKGRRLVLLSVAVVSLAAVAFLLACQYTPHDNQLWASLNERVRGLTVPGGREHIWQAALALYRDHPLFGCGLDAFHLAFGQKRTVALWATEWNITPSHAHNAALQVLATQGLLGIAALGALSASLAFAAVRAWRRAPRERRLFIVALSAGIVGFAVQNVFSFTVAGQGTLFVTFAALLARLAVAGGESSAPRPLCRVGYATGLVTGDLLFVAIFLHNLDAEFARSIPRSTEGIFAVLAGLGVATFTLWMLESRGQEAVTSDTTAEDVPAGRWLWIARGVAVLAAVALADRMVVRPFYADCACRRGDQLLPEDLGKAVEAYVEATARVPDNDFYWSKLGAAARVGVERLHDRDERRQLVERGREAYARAVQLVPVDASHHVGLGRMLMELCRLRLAAPGEALAEYDRALALDSNNAIYYADAANAALVMDRFETARSYAMRGIARYPWFGPLTAHLGYIAMVENQPAEATGMLTMALGQRWYQEDSARKFAEAMLAKSRGRLDSVNLTASVPKTRGAPTNP